MDYMVCSQRRDDVILLRADGVHGAYGVVSAVVMLFLFVRTVFAGHLVCYQVS